MKKVRHFVNLHDLSSTELRGLIQRATELKQQQDANYQPLKGKVLAMIFEKSSTRTRISFEAGMSNFGGSAIFLSPRDTQLGRGEPLADSAKVISSMVDCIMLRTNLHETVTTFAEYSSVPVINGLTDFSHPCQVLADMETYFEHRGDICGKTVTWIGAGNNMCHSYIDAAMCLDFKINIACPKGYEPDAELVAKAGDRVSFFQEPKAAAKNSDLIVTDVWVSMGEEQEQEKRLQDFKAYQVNQAVMSQANADTLFMHCLPAHRGEEVTAEVIDGAQSVVFPEAENRLHVQKALLEFLICA
jgi:ornithine carbamoyltransferase